MTKVVNDFRSNVVNITTFIEVVVLEKCCKIYNGYSYWIANKKAPVVRAKRL